MNRSIVNLTFIDVSAELENLLVFYPAQIQKNIVANPDLRQKLVSYVLKRINNHYIALGNEDRAAISPRVLYCSTLEQLEIEELIKQGIYYLFFKQKIINRCRNIDSIFSP